MKTRRATIAVVLSLSVAAAGVAGAVGGSNQRHPDQTRGTGLMTACAAMRGTPAMERMHAALPDAIQARCEPMHIDMAMMMGGPEMTD